MTSQEDLELILLRLIAENEPCMIQTISGLLWPYATSVEILAKKQAMPEVLDGLVGQGVLLLNEYKMYSLTSSGRKELERLELLNLMKHTGRR